METQPACPASGTRRASPCSITDACCDLTPVLTVAVAVMLISVFAVPGVTDLPVVVPISVTVIVIQPTVMATVMPMPGIAVMITPTPVMFEVTPEVTPVLRVRVAMVSTVMGGRMMSILCLGRGRQAEA